MTVLAFYSDVDAPGPWCEALTALDPALEFRGWPDWGDRSVIEHALAWRPPPGLLATLPRLKVVFSLGAGIDHLLVAGALPPNVTVVRMVDADLTRGMTEYVLLNVLYHHRRMFDYRRQQAREEWREVPQVAAARRRVGVMGTGVLGRAALDRLGDLGFDLAAWSRTRKTGQGFRSYAGPSELHDFLSRTDILVVLLPDTPETRGILAGRALACLPRGAAVINAGRGALLVERDLLELLDSGHLYGASLDVFADEPLPPGHPFWSHPRVLVTPHVASVTQPRSAAAGIVRGLQRSRAGEPLQHIVDRARGY